MIPTAHQRLGLCSVALLLLSPPWPGHECRLLARAGSVDNKIDGKWQEFGFNSGPNQEAFACSTTPVLHECSSDPDSEELGDNNAPWTVKPSTSCLLLEVMEGYGGGQAVFEVFNDEVSMGRTADVPIAEGSTSCQRDPFGCNQEATGVGKGQFLLQKNVEYNLHFIAVRSDTTEKTDGGWFRLKTTTGCEPPDPNPIPDPLCPTVGEKCTKANPCCGGLECRPSNGNGRRCVPPDVTGDKPPSLDCANAKETCGDGVQCCEGEGLVCRLNQATGARTCRKQAKCAHAQHLCGNVQKCCEGLVCRRSRPNGARRCHKKNSNPETNCAVLKETCGNGVNCCEGLVCRPDKGTGKRKCRTKKNGGDGGTTMGTGSNGGGGGGNGGGGGGAEVGPMGIGVP